LNHINNNHNLINVIFKTLQKILPFEEKNANFYANILGKYLRVITSMSMEVLASCKKSSFLSSLGYKS